MAATRKIPIVRLCELKPDQTADVFVQLCEKRPASTREGKPYFLCKFRDAKRTVSTYPLWSDGLWFDECQASWTLGEFYKVRGRLSEKERYGLQLELEQVRPVHERDRDDGFSEELFVDASRKDPEVEFAALLELTTEVRDEPLRALVRLLLEKNAPKVKSMPATAARFYTFPGGWLEHTLAVARTCVWLADQFLARYPDVKLNRDLVLAGAILHDLGRLLEADAPVPGLPPETNRAGGLFGQHFLAFAAIQEASREVPELNPELVELLQHIIVSHLAVPEWGSPRLPKVPEALIIHHADDLDAKFEMYARCLERDTSVGPFTSRDAGLGREILKDRKV